MMAKTEIGTGKPGKREEGVRTKKAGRAVQEASGDQGQNGGLPENKIQGMINTDIGPAYRDDHPYTARDDQCTQDAPKKVLFIQT